MTDEPLDSDAPELAVVASLGQLRINDCSDEEVRLARLLHEPWADETLEAATPSDRSIVLKQARMALVYARRDGTTAAERVQTLCHSAGDYFHKNESPAQAVRAVPVADLRAATGESPTRRVYTNPDIDLRPDQGFGRLWRWHCHDCGMGSAFETEGRAEESIETHLRADHREAWLKAKEGSRDGGD